MTEIMLSDEGYNVIVTASAREGLAMLQAQKVDLIITDIIMPEMEGIELITQLKPGPSEPADHGDFRGRPIAQHGFPQVREEARRQDRSREAVSAGGAAGTP